MNRSRLNREALFDDELPEVDPDDPDFPDGEADEDEAEEADTEIPADLDIPGSYRYEHEEYGD